LTVSDADLLALTDAQREFVIERYAALDVYGRFCLDLKKTIMDKAPDPATALRRLRQVREFISQQVASAFRTVRERGAPATTANVARLTAQRSARRSMCSRSTRHEICQRTNLRAHERR
jgi:hypothetical protein